MQFIIRILLINADKRTRGLTGHLAFYLHVDCISYICNDLLLRENEAETRNRTDLVRRVVIVKWESLYENHYYRGWKGRLCFS